MKRLFGSKKAAPRAAETAPAPPVDLAETLVRTEERANACEGQLKPLEEDIRALFAKMRATTIASEKQYLKSRLAQKLVRRNQLMQQLDRTNHRLGLITSVQGSLQGARDTAEMAQLLRGTNQALKQQMGAVNYDELRDHIEDMNELGYENDALVREMNEQFSAQVDEDIDEQLANLENELALQELVQPGQGRAPQQYAPVKQ